MKRVPLVPTVLVALAIATMIALGLWQLLDRRPQKLAFLAQLAANPTKPPVPFPPTPDDRLLFRRSSASCAQPMSVRLAGAGASGFRAIATCPGSLQIQLGTTHDPNATVMWAGGTVSGYLSHAPDPRPLLAGLWDRRPTPLLLVADTPPPGLSRNAPPDVNGVPNNHLAYAGQWFFFAAVAAIIYALALRRRSGE